MAKFNYVPMPLNEDGNGPASEEETVSISHQVWDLADCGTVCTASSAYYASIIAQHLNELWEAGLLQEQA